MADRSKKPAMPITRECDHCAGSGEVEVFCHDCGDELFTNNVGEHDSGDYLCEGCADERRADEAGEASQPGGTDPR